MTSLSFLKRFSSSKFSPFLSSSAGVVEVSRFTNVNFLLLAALSTNDTSSMSILASLALRKFLLAILFPTLLDMVMHFQVSSNRSSVDSTLTHLTRARLALFHNVVVRQFDNPLFVLEQIVV